ncbi:hypothetical protein [Litoreibacter roseus]|uniref:Lipoprotein n=1 Tax=Litoreibacter roseus TaxID=2601869 RepID=A0A6N6JAX2_9RHOB|nr:hypothetical protein [Litoreibacter roseus]GFE63286.1 hypothetical protein KIN_03600 [Litoreibacter roseus]
MKVLSNFAVLIALCGGLAACGQGGVTQDQLNAVARACEDRHGVTATTLTYDYSYSSRSGTTYRLEPGTGVSATQAARVNACIDNSIVR